MRLFEVAIFYKDNQKKTIFATMHTTSSKCITTHDELDVPQNNW